MCKKAGRARLEHRPIRSDARGRHRGQRRAVIAPGAADDLVLVGLAETLPIVAGRLEGRFVRLRAAGGEEKAVDARIAQAREPLGQLDGRPIGAAGVARGVAQLSHLPRGGLGQFVAAVADDDVPQAGQAIEKLAARLVDQHGAAAFDPDVRVLLRGRPVQRVEQVCPIAGPIVAVAVIIVAPMSMPGFRGKRREKASFYRQDAAQTSVERIENASAMARSAMHATACTQAALMPCDENTA